jgi:hypothetical protein
MLLQFHSMPAKTGVMQLELLLLQLLQQQKPGTHGRAHLKVLGVR